MPVKPDKSISKDIWEQICFLADPTTKWVRELPRKENTACAIVRVTLEDGHLKWGSFIKHGGLDAPAREFIRFHLMETETPLLPSFESPFPIKPRPYPVHLWNDQVAKNKQEVIWLLEEAYYLAKDMGL